MLIYLVSIIGIFILAYFLFVNFYPSFGGDVSSERQALYSDSKQFEEGLFKNTTPGVPQEFSFGQMLKISRKFFFENVPNGRPKANLEVQKLDSSSVTDYTGDTRFIWYGHSAFLLQTKGLNILLDPMFGEVAAPHPWLGTKRVNAEMPLEIEKLPQIDAVIISHDHYDHLDYGTLKTLKHKVGHFFVPLGVGVHLEAWGIPTAQITELDWWQETTYKDLKLSCTPSQHFSGRKLGKNQTTLWCSWVIQTTTENIYFSGDSGYGYHFKEIGKKYGPFDFAMLECGQYNPMWADIHMMPEETAQAGLDLRAKTIMPIHWGGFKLALHSWTDPIERVSKKAKELNVSLVTPKIGEVLVVKDSTQVFSNWWEGL